MTLPSMSVLSDNALRDTKGRSQMRTEEDRARERDRWAKMSPESREKHKAKSKAWRLAHPEKMREYNRASQLRAKAANPKYHQESNKRRYAALSPAERLWKSAQDRARKKGRPFEIAPTDVQIPEKCPVLGIPMQHHKGSPQNNSPSIDRIDSTKGYTPDNVFVMSWRANSLKKDATFEEIEMLYHHMLRLRDQGVRFDEGKLPT